MSSFKPLLSCLTPDPMAWALRPTLPHWIRAQVWPSNAFYLIARHLLDLELLDCGCLWVLTDASRQTPYLVPIVRAQGRVKLIVCE